MPATGHPVFARFYSRVAEPCFARFGGDHLRRRALAGLSGTVVEIGPGDGANFPLYPAEVTRLVAVEPEPWLREQAETRAAARVEVVAGTAETLPLDDGEADALVSTLVLCSVADQGAVLAEARRVLRPGGELRFLEHVQAHDPGLLRRLQRGLDATVWPRLFGGCHCGRDTVGAIEAAGFDVVEVDRFLFPPGSRSPVSPSVLGRAVAR
ncbi:MAG TPA: class I SAM-dependent methyltransferase [Marmoricola sp.]|nr:class I SAM-dependent methyltransferase [Marmoricola sp.]